MSGALAIDVFGGAAAIAGAESILIRPLRAIGYVIPDIVVEELHRDELTITEHPVEQGAAISDHAYKRPKEVSLHACWSPSVGGYDGYLEEVYAELVALQESRQPFVLMTGKRLYQNMLLATLAVTTDAAREHMLDVHAVCREVILVQTSTATLPPQEQHAMPSQTAPVQDTGVKQPAAQNSSVLNSLLGSGSSTPQSDFALLHGGAI